MGVYHIPTNTDASPLGKKSFYTLHKPNAITSQKTQINEIVQLFISEIFVTVSWTAMAQTESN